MRSVVRTRLWTIALAVVFILLPHAALAQSTSADVRTVSGEAIASVTLSQAAQDVLISIAFRNRTALVGTHALEIHADGRCDAPAFDSSGPMLIGLPNLVIGPAGVGVYNVSAPGTTLAALLGRSLLIFEGPTSNPGARIACGVIGTPPSSSDRPDPMTSLGIAVMGGLLIVAGVLLRRGA